MGFFETDSRIPLEKNDGLFSYIDAFVRGNKDQLFLARTPTKFSVALIADQDYQGAYVVNYVSPAYYRKDPFMDLSVAYYDFEQAKSTAIALIGKWTKEVVSGKAGVISSGTLPSYCFREDTPLHYPQWQRVDGMQMTGKESWHCYNKMAELLNAGNMLPVEEVIGLITSAESSSEQR